MNNKWLIIKQLDKQLSVWKAASDQYGTPRVGWVKTIRVALCMTAAQLAQRLQLTHSRIKQLENAEIHDAVTLRTLKETADALGCEFVYAFVPKNNTTLKSIIKKQAESVSKERVAGIAHSMRLEAQAIDVEMVNSQQEELYQQLIQRPNKTLWQDEKFLAEDKHKKFIARLKKGIK